MPCYYDDYDRYGLERPEHLQREMNPGAFLRRDREKAAKEAAEHAETRQRAHHQRVATQVLLLLEEMESGNPVDPALYNHGIRKEATECTYQNLDEWTAELCSLLKVRGGADGLSLEMQLWWRDHQAADKRREEREYDKEIQTLLDRYRNDVEFYNFVNAVRLDARRADGPLLPLAIKLAAALPPDRPNSEPPKE